VGIDEAGQHRPAGEIGMRRRRACLRNGIALAARERDAALLHHDSLDVGRRVAGHGENRATGVDGGP
jgi:hypothetical protein